MSTTSAEPALPPRAFRQVIARHPVAAMLLLMFVIGWAFLIPAALTGVSLIPRLGRQGEGIAAQEVDVPEAPVRAEPDPQPGPRGPAGAVGVTARYM